jgi:hypothetical protein
MTLQKSAFRWLHEAANWHVRSENERLPAQLFPAAGAVGTMTRAHRLARRVRDGFVELSLNL